MHAMLAWQELNRQYRRCLMGAHPKSRLGRFRFSQENCRRGWV